MFTVAHAWPDVLAALVSAAGFTGDGVHVALTLLSLLSVIVPIFGVTTTDIIEAFKYTYSQDRLSYYASEEVVLWNILSKRKKEIGGRGQWIEPIQVRDAGVFVGHAESGALTTRRAQPDTTEAMFSLQEFHGIWDVSWKALQDARKSEYAFTRVLDFMEMSFRRRVLRLLNADLIGTGKGELGVLPAADNDTVITVNALPLAPLGLYVDVMDASDDNTKLAAARTVNSVSKSPTREITISGAAIAGSAAGDYFTVADSVSSAGSLHMNGILGVISSSNPPAVVGNYGGINRATAGNEFWQATEFSNGGVLRPMDENLFLSGIDAVREFGGSQIKVLLSNLAILRQYHQMLRSETFYSLRPDDSPVSVGASMGRTGEMSAGKDSMGQTPYQFGAYDWRAEPFMQPNVVIGLDPEEFWIGHGENEVPAPLSEIFDGLVPFFKSTANASFEVVTYWQGDLLTRNPAAGMRFNDIAES